MFRNDFLFNACKTNYQWKKLIINSNFNLLQFGSLSSKIKIINKLINDDDTIINFYVEKLKKYSNIKL